MHRALSVTTFLVALAANWSRLVAATVYQSPTCTCTSVGTVFYSDGRPSVCPPSVGCPPTYGPATPMPPTYGGPLTVSNGTSFILTTSSSTAAFAYEIYPKLVGTFACYCAVNPSNSFDTRYLMYANQTDPALGPASECLTVEVVDYVCAGMKDIGLLECVTTWSGGASALSSRTLYDYGVLGSVMQKMIVKHGAKCASTIDVIVIMDTITVTDV